MVARGQWFTHRFFIGSEIFERLRSPGYTPSVSLSLDSSLREGAGDNIPPQRQSPARWMFRQRAGDFWGFCVGVCFAIQPGTCETVGVRAIFIAPTKL